MGVAADGDTAREPVVAWLSLGFGYGGDLMYFEQLFEGLQSRFPKAIVPVASSFPVQRYPKLPLLPILKFADIPLPRRQAGGSAYATVVRLATPASVIRLGRERPEVLVITEFSLVSLAGWLLAKLRRIPLVLLVESDPSYRGAPSAPAVMAVKSFIARRCDAILVSNQLGADYLTKNLRVAPDRIRIGPYLTSNPAGPTPTSTGRRTGRVRLLFLNSITQRKGVAEMLRALARTPLELRDSWQLDVVGSGDQEAEVRRLTAELDLTANVIWHGRVPFPETGEFYRQADVVISPTLADYRSLSGFEAVNAGRALITSVHDGASEELVRLAHSVRLVDPLDQESFAEALRPYLTRSDWLRAQAAAAQKPPVEFSVEAACDNLAATINDALDRRAGRA